jgi:polysaccharide biosynthesis protein PelA
MKRFFLFILILSIFVFFSSFLYCQTKINRTILAVYNGTEDTNISNNLEIILNNLGFKVRYQDINLAMPSDKEMKDVYGIVSWLTDSEFYNASKYCDWIQKQVSLGKKFVMIDNGLVYVDKKTKKEIPLSQYEKIYSIIGLKFNNDISYNPLFISINFKDKKVMEFERTLDNDILFFSSVGLLDKNGKVFLRLKNEKTNNLSDSVVVTSKGGFILNGCAIYGLRENVKNWYVNPFVFFKKALEIKDDYPIFDLTTLYGNRILYSHIDGDGFRNACLDRKDGYSSEVIYKEILKKYNIPITVSFITTDIDKRYYGNRVFEKIVSNIAKLDNVELAVHGFTHPLDWSKKLTAIEIPGYSKRNNLDPKDVEIMSESAYSHLSYLSYIYVDYKSFFNKEIVESKKVTEKILKENNINKKIKIFLWTGDCSPQYEAINLAYKNALLNMNGKGSKFDSEYPSYLGLAPFYKDNNGLIQVYTTNFNEHIYTNSWTGPFFGFEKVIETFNQTEIADKIRTKNIRRILPINIYYHFYIAERLSGLNSLKKVYDYVLNKNEVIPIFTSRYIKMVLGFTKAEIYKNSDGSYIFNNYGKDSTVRLESNNYLPELNKCEGVLGFYEWNGYVYIHLVDDGPSKLVLIKRENFNQNVKKIYLEKSNVLIQNLKIEKSKIKFDTQCYGNTIIIFRNLKKNFIYELKMGNKVIERFKSDQKGKLIIRIDLVGKLNLLIEEKIG